jgi:AraC family transcriptional regulator of arabinose operon
MTDRRLITPSAEANPLICSEFREGRNYTNWRPQGSGDWLLIFTLAGAGRVVSAGRAQRLLPGDSVLFAPGAEQDYSTDPDAGHWHLRWAHFHPRPHWRPWLLWPEIAPRTGKVEVRGAEAGEIATVLQRMLVAHRLGEEGGDDLAMNALEEVLIRCARSSPAAARSGVDERVRRAVRYLAMHPAESFRLDRLARHCGLSVSRLSHLFREELGTSPQRFSEKLRLECARDLLTQTRLSIGEVAAEVGFSDPLYFSRRYRRAFGHAPRFEAVHKRRRTDGRK